MAEFISVDVEQRRRDDPAAAAPDECPVPADAARDQGRGGGGRLAVGRRRRDPLRRAEGVRRRRRHQGDGRHDLPGHAARLGRPAGRLHVGRPHPAADHRRGDRVRTRRRLRAVPVLRPADRGGRRQAGPARDPARHHPRCRRHAAAAAPRRRRAGQGADLHRPPGRCRRRHWPSGSPTRSCRRRTSSRPRRSWPQRLAKGPALALRAAKEAVDHGLDTDLATGLDIERVRFAALFATDDQSIGMAAFMEKRPAEFTGN